MLEQLLAGFRAAGPSEGALDLSAPAPPKFTPMFKLIGSDGDQRILVKDVEAQPWRALVCLQVTHKDGDRTVGTGLMIAPNIVLTAAHNLYSLKLQKIIASGRAEVGVKDGACRAEARIKHVIVARKYTAMHPADSARYRHDYGVAFLEGAALGEWCKTHVDIAGQAPMPDKDLHASELIVAGYPVESGPLALKSDAGRMLAATTTPTNFRYRMDTMPGQSGAPVFRFQDGAFALAGVHVAGELDFNLARRFDAAMRDDVLRWMAKRV